MMASLVSFFDRDGASYDLDQFKNSFSNNSFDGITIDKKGIAAVLAEAKANDNVLV